MWDGVSFNWQDHVIPALTEICTICRVSPLHHPPQPLPIKAPHHTFFINYCNANKSRILPHLRIEFQSASIQDENRIEKINWSKSRIYWNMIRLLHEVWIEFGQNHLTISPVSKLEDAFYPDKNIFHLFYVYLMLMNWSQRKCLKRRRYSKLRLNSNQPK